MSNDSLWDSFDDPDEETIKRLLAQLGITPDADGNIDLEQVMSQMQQLMTNFSTQMAGFGPSDPGSGINWAFTLDIANQALSNPKHWKATPEQLQSISDATFVANMWLDDEISFDALPFLPQAWSKSEWLANTFATWQQLETPIINSLSATMQSMIAFEDSNAAVMAPMIRAAAAGVFSSQIGRALASLAEQTLSATDVGLPVTPTPTVALLPTNIERFGADLDLPFGDVLLFLALRECARGRLFRAVGWLAPQLLAMIEHYAREISIDPDALGKAVEQQLRDSTRVEDLQSVGLSLANSLFKPTISPAQREILDRLETLVALVEGWVDAVVTQVTRDRMPSAASLAEMITRRRASVGSSADSLHSLLGLELRPRRLREARTLWTAIRSYRSAAERDASWSHPDFIPTAQDLIDPLEYAQHGHQSQSTDDFDLDLEKLLGPDEPAQD
ncbi:MAG: zinc-dependent metalloprotease [Propionibacteriaceae bacterium]|jgi:putative hydrolase|nr:zinc-dependent metalloprotease [Propionibacteriaceae bacterium]